MTVLDSERMYRTHLHNIKYISMSVCIVHLCCDGCICICVCSSSKKEIKGYANPCFDFIMYKEEKKKKGSSMM
jgi:hypothetical protein